MAEEAIVPANASSDKLKAYFAKVLPNYDRDRVSVSDIKKIIKWFNFLNDRNLLNESEVNASDEEE